MSVNLLANNIGVVQANALIEILKSKDTLKTLCGFSGNETELDLSGQGLNAGCGVLVANEVRDNGALVSVNLLNNAIGAEQAQNLVAILKEHASLKSLCGNKGDETELDMSGKNMGADSAIMLAPEIVANGALTSLNILNNDIEKTGAGFLEGAWKSHKTLKTICGASDELDLSGKLGNDLPVVVVELKYNGALTGVDITNNGCKDGEFIDAIKCRANTQQCVGPLTELSCDDVIEWINKTRDLKAFLMVTHYYSSSRYVLPPPNICEELLRRIGSYL